MSPKRKSIQVRPKRSDVLVVNDYFRQNGSSEDGGMTVATSELLRHMLEQVGVSNYRTIPLCPNPSTKAPTAKAALKFMDSFYNGIKWMKPRYVLLLGTLPSKVIPDKPTKRPFKKDGVIYFPIPHPGIIFHDPLKARAIETSLSFFRLIIERGEIPSEENLNIRIVSSEEDIEELIEDLNENDDISFDIETTCLYPWEKGAAINALGFGTERYQWSIPVSHYESPWKPTRLNQLVDELTDLLEEKSLIAHNGKFDALWMRVFYGVEWDIGFDTMMAHYMMDENARHDLKLLSKQYCGAFDYDLETDKKKGNVPFNELASYHAHDLYYTRKLYPIFLKALRNEGNVYRVFREIIMPCVNIFVDIEYNGVYVDVSKFHEAEQYLKEQIDQALKELSKFTSDPDMNWGSTKQLGKLLFEDLGIPAVTTKKGNYSTSESVLNNIDHPIRHAILRYRAAKQQLSFFIEGWKPFLDGSYLHPSFKIHGTVTGRLSCEHPNLQQVPRDKRIRGLITAKKGWTLVETDLSQIELRIAAELAGEQNMLHAFEQGIDVHWLTAIREIARGQALVDTVEKTASKLASKKLRYGEAIEVLIRSGHSAAEKIDKIWAEYRKKAKAINFGYLYGMWWKKFKIYAKDNYGVDVTDEQAQASRAAFFELYPDFPDWHSRQKRYAKRNGYVATLSGRKRRLPEAMMSSDSPERRGAERKAINSPVQSFANELNLMSLIEGYEVFPRHKVKFVGTVHDAILARVRDDYVSTYTEKMLDIMSRPKLMKKFNIKVRVPIEAEEKIGAWGSGISLKDWKEKHEGKSIKG